MIDDTVSYYKIQCVINHGGFGSVYLVGTEENLYCMKVEPKTSKRKTLNFETKILRRVQNSSNFPKFISNGSTYDFEFLVMEALGPNLKEIKENLPKGRFSKRFVGRLFVEMLDCIKVFHSYGYIHRDIKPQNFCCRLKGDLPLCCIDFGVSKLYMDDRGRIIPDENTRTNVGTPLFSSPNTLRKVKLSRRDDLISLVYSIIELSGFDLPWKRCNNLYDIHTLKMKYRLPELCRPLGSNFVAIGKYISELDVDTQPNYSYIRKLAMEGSVRDFEWMNTYPKEEVPFIKENNFDPTGFLAALCPHLVKKDKDKDKKCFI